MEFSCKILMCESLCVFPSGHVHVWSLIFTVLQKSATFCHFQNNIAQWSLYRLILSHQCIIWKHINSTSWKARNINYAARSLFTIIMWFWVLLFLGRTTEMHQKMDTLQKESSKDSSWCLVWATIICLSTASLSFLTPCSD